jgi:RNA polymerase sigma factor (TIGR02999 family)
MGSGAVGWTGAGRYAGAALSRQQITQLLHRWQQGDMQAREHLFEAMYSDLMQLARNRLSQQTNGTLQPAALVNESLMRLLGSDAEYKDRTHFVAIAALKMRSVLVDHLRARAASKRGAGVEQLTLSHADQAYEESNIGYDVLALHQALNQLAEMEPRAASTIELTYFGGMQRDEIALVLGVSAPTVDRDLRFARAWLNRQLR